MTPIKEYIGKCFVGKTFNFTCNCVMNLNVTGVVTDYEIIGMEIVLIVANHNNKIVRIGLNTPSLSIKEL